MDKIEILGYLYRQLEINKENAKSEKVCTIQEQRMLNDTKTIKEIISIILLTKET